MGNVDVPFSPIVVVDNVAYVSGQLPIDEKGDLAVGVGPQTTQCLSNLLHILKKEGFDLKDVVKTTVYLTDFAKFGEMNSAYIDFFNGIKPARSACGVSMLAKGATVEIDCIAMKKRF